MGRMGRPRQPHHCYKCGETDPSKFAKSTSHWSGLQNRCKACIKEGWTPQLRRLYGTIRAHHITEADYESLVTAQGGVCAVCGNPPDRKHLAIDHDHGCCPGTHSCGRCVRGLLCFRCNSMLGHAEDDLDLLRRGVNYLQRYTDIQPLQ